MSSCMCSYFGLYAALYDCIIPCQAGLYLLIIQFHALMSHVHQGSALARVFQVQGLSLAWRTRSPCEVETPALDKRVHGMQLLLQPMSCALQLSSSTGADPSLHITICDTCNCLSQLLAISKAANACSPLCAGDHTFKHGSQQLSASLLISRVQWSICRSQIYDAMQLLDDIHLWHLRNRVAVMRPATRQTGSSWRYS